jgi:tRNA nucleotidyltransferase (CCA-adding enzyme)
MTSLPPRLAKAQIPEFVLETCRTLQQAGHQAFLVGGCVRDLLSGRKPKDYDVTTSAKPEVVLGLFPKTVPTGIQHGTVTVVKRDGIVEVTTFRGEGAYSDGRRPDQVFYLEEIEGDLARRDFTMNAIAFDPARGGLVDPFGGATDLGAKLVRCVGKADERFGEDGLRPLRAVRFVSVLRFKLDPETKAAIGRALPTYAKVAQERVSDELRKLLVGPRPSVGLALLAETGLASRILPALSSETEAERQVRLRRVNFVPRRYVLRLAALFRGHTERLEEMKLPNDVIQHAAHLDRFRVPLGASVSDAELRRFVSQVGLAKLHDVLVMERAELGARNDRDGLKSLAQTRGRLKDLLAQKPPLTIGELALNGNQVAEVLGGKGPKVGQALRKLLDAALDDPSQNTAERLKALLLKPGFVS